jgi:hypothetical protein
MDKENIVLLSHKENGWTGDHHVEQDKPSSKRQI